MPYDLALYDLVSPYVLKGDTFGQWHAALSVLYVAEYTVAVDDDGIVIRGTARFSGSASGYIDPSSMSFGVNPENTEGHPANDPGRRDPWIDIHDAHIDFQLSAPRIPSQKIATAVTQIGNAASFANAAAVLSQYGPTAAGTLPSDYASTEFTLDLLLTTVILRPPFLVGAKLDPSGILVEDPNNKQVKISLPKIKARLTQGSAATDPLRATLLSLGASGLDDTGDLGVAQLITMDPPYAFVGSSKVVGIGFRSATLDLSEGSTPPDVLSQFGFDESWTGLYFPELRLFIAPHGAEDLAFSASATNLLIGIGQSAGVTGDFELALVDQGSGSVKVSARFYDARGRCYGVQKSSDGTTATVTIPKTTRMVVDIDGGLTPHMGSAKIGGGAVQPGRLFDVDFGTATSLTIVVTGTGSQPGATPTTLTITAALQQQSALPPAGTSTSSTTPDATIKTTSITQNGATVATPALRIIAQDSVHATVALDTDPGTAAQTMWSVDGASSGPSATVQVDCAPGASVNVQATLPGKTGATTFTGYYRFDHPRPGVDNPATYTADPNNTHTTPAADEGLAAPWPGGSDIATALNPILDTLPNGAAITVKGYASFESHDSPAPGSSDFHYNQQLALNRAQGLAAIINQHVSGFAVTPSADMSGWGPTQGDPTRNIWWKAVATWPPTNTPSTVITGVVHRDPAPNQPIPVPVPVPDNPKDATPPDPPSWFKKVDAKVRIVRNHFVACELSGKFDIQTPSENELAAGGVPGNKIPSWGDVGSQNPADGIIDVRIVVQIDESTDVVKVSGYFGADPADKDGLKMIGWLPPAPNPLPSLSGAAQYGQNFLGLGIAFWPLISSAAGSVANDGASVELAVTGAGFGVIAGMAALDWFNVERVVWYGGELDVEVRPDGTQVKVLVDIESAISARIHFGSLDIITIPRESPLVVRYKAIGFLIGRPAGQPAFQFRPVFDSSKGFTIDVSKPGAIQVASPFDKILKILGARISRNNPFFVEVDLGFSVDLGVVTIDRARVRLNLSPGGPPELTAFGASVDIPGAVRGRGSMSMGDDGAGNTVISGSLDLTIVPVEVRIAATLQIAQISAANGGPATGVKVTLEVDFPVAIPLGTSGLGIYGFIGLFAINFARDESKIPAGSGPAMAPALAWLKATGGDPTNNDFWKPKINTWAFGVGALLGTEGSDIIFNLKGIFLLELPGPRLLLMMKANLLIPPSVLKSGAEGMFLAVIDLDFGRGTMTIGLSIDFNVDPLLQITIPVEAFFNFNDTSDWHLYLGTYSGPVHAMVLSVFEASGYVMLSGSGIPSHPVGLSGNSLPAVTGFSIGAGLHVSFTWGGGPLYAQLSAGFDAVVGFSPFRMAGVLEVRGSLHLFIIDISAWAELTVDVGDDGHGGHIAQITGDICGKVEFLFFSVSGCVSFSLGGDAIPAPPAPPLAKSLKLVSRSPALLSGSGTSDKPIDSSLGDGVENDGAAPADGDLPVVPIDVVPALMLTMPPLQDSALKFKGQAIGGTPDAPGDGWVQRGDMWYQYTITGVDLVGAVTAGKTPAVWWNTKAGDKALEAQLALMSWVPDPTPKAVGSSKYLDQTITEKWGNSCQGAAPGAPVIWSFFFQPLGPSAHGWKPYGLAFPDPPGTIRSSPADTTLKVTERWRTGNALFDNLRGIIPAEIEGAPVQCPKAGVPPPAFPGAANNPTFSGPAVSSQPLVRTIAPSVVASLGTTHTPNVISAMATAAASAALTSVSVSLADNPVLKIRGTAREAINAAEAATVDQAFTKMLNGEAISRATLASSALLGAAFAGAANAVGTPPACFGWALASPLFDNGALTGPGMGQFEEYLKQQSTHIHFKPGPLDDAVVFDFGEEFRYARFFMWVPARFLNNTVVVAASDAADHLTNAHTITAADLIGPSSLPASWTSVTSIWEPVTVVLEELAVQARNYVPVFVEVKGAPGATRVQIGCNKGALHLREVITLRPFYVGGIEALKKSEQVRSAYDDTQQTNKKGVLNDALGLDSADNALLVPNTTYQVSITTTANSQQRPAGKDPSTVTTTTQNQSFYFRTDANPPAKLDPWVLVALPGEAEKHYFASDAVKIVFATNNVATLYGAYNKKLQVRLRPSSYVPVPSTPAVPHPLPLDATNLVPLKGVVFSPWEGAVRAQAANLPCINASGETIRHSMVTIPIPLDLYTDYLIDIEMVDKGAPEGTAGTRVWRGSFSTGGFRDETDFAHSFFASKINHRGVAAANVAGLQGIGPSFASRQPHGDEFDTALHDQGGLEAMPVPKNPAFTVLWDPSSPPQPLAVLVDATEPMWREHPIPTQITDPGPHAAKWYELVSKPWLALAQQAGGDDLVDSIVVAPGGQRALVTLKPNARGKHLRLALKHIAYTEPYLDGPGATDSFFTVLDKVLSVAPWEEVD